MNSEDLNKNNAVDSDINEVNLPKYENKPGACLIVKDEFRKQDLRRLRVVLYPGLLLIAAVIDLSLTYIYTTKAFAYKSEVETKMESMRLGLFNSSSCLVSSDTYKEDSLLRVMREDRPLLKRSHAPEKLVTVLNSYTRGFQSQYISDEIETDFYEMMNAARNEGHYLELNSAYRSFSLQADWFETSVAKGVHDLTAIPGSSEHQLGTAIDISSHQGESATIAGYAWLASNAHKYGFHLTYPSGREEETGFGYEPWHWRYIGKELSQEYKESGELFNFGEDMFLKSEDYFYSHNYFGDYLGVYLFKDKSTKKILLDNGIEQMYSISAIYKDFEKALDGKNLLSGKIEISIRGIPIMVHGRYIEKIDAYLLFAYENVNGVKYSDAQIDDTLSKICPAL